MVPLWSRPLVQELAGDRAGVTGVGEPGLLGERVGVQPVEQTPAHAADDAHLGIVDVGVHEAGEEEARPEVHDLRGRRPRPRLAEAPGAHDAAVLDEEAPSSIARRAPANDERTPRGVEERRPQEERGSGRHAAGRASLSS